METIDWAKVERQFHALEMVGHIITTFERATRGRRGRRTGSVTLAGVDVFEALSYKRGAFARPVSFRRDELIERCGLSGRGIDLALKRLVDEGLLTISGSLEAPMGQLQIPPKVFASYQRDDNQIAEGPHDMAVERHQLDEALALLDDPDFEHYAQREPVLLRDPWLGRSDRPA